MVRSKGPIVSERVLSVAKRSRRIALRPSTVVLMLALCGLLLRLSGGGSLLNQVSGQAALLLVGMAPIWALLGSVLATVYLVLTVWRPYSAGQHLVEMVAGVLLTLLLLPVF
jgi:TRAP-type C4-dicarboxylate transport system permease small subunit